MFLTGEDEGAVDSFEGEEIEFPFPFLPAPPGHGISVGAVVVGEAVGVGAEDMEFGRRERQGGGQGELVAAVP